MATCEERVRQNLDDRLTTLRNLWETFLEDTEAYNEEEETNLDEFGLSFDYVTPYTFSDQNEGYFRYQLSTGGPGDEFRFFTNPDFSVHRIEYWFLDWWDGASRRLYGVDFDFMNELFAVFFEGSTEHVYEKAMEDWEPQHEEEDEDYEWLFDDDTDDEEKDVTIRTIEDIKETLRNISEGGLRS